MGESCSSYGAAMGECHAENSLQQKEGLDREERMQILLALEKITKTIGAIIFLAKITDPTTILTSALFRVFSAMEESNSFESFAKNFGEELVSILPEVLHDITGITKIAENFTKQNSENRVEIIEAVLILKKEAAFLDAAVRIPHYRETMRA